MSAVIVDVARTANTKSWSGSFNLTHPLRLGGAAVAGLIARNAVEPGEVEDVIIGCANQEGAAGGNVGRLTALSAGLPASVPGQSVNRLCASGLQAIASASHRIAAGEATLLVAGGSESISVVQDKMNRHLAQDTDLQKRVPGVYMPMLQTAEVVAERYGIGREVQDAYGVRSHLRAAAAQRAGLFDEEIVAVETTTLVGRAAEALTVVSTTVAADEGIRADATIEKTGALRPVVRGGTVTAGNASGFADGAAVALVMDERTAEQRGLEPLGRFVSYAVAGCAPDEMGIGPALAVPLLLERAGLSIDDIDVWELNEAFASQVLYCRDALGIPDERLNVNGGAIAIGHPYGSSGARMVGHALRETRRRGGRYAIATM